MRKCVLFLILFIVSLLLAISLQSGNEQLNEKSKYTNAKEKEGHQKLEKTPPKTAPRNKKTARRA